MDEEIDFLAGLEANEDDTELRMLYADWLEERGEDEEAERQRKWPEAKAWLVEFARTHAPRKVDMGDFDVTHGITYEGLLILGRECRDNDLVSFGTDDYLMEAVQCVYVTFMENWSIVTGETISEDKGWPRFKCAC